MKRLVDRLRGPATAWLTSAVLGAALLALGAPGGYLGALVAVVAAAAWLGAFVLLRRDRLLVVSGLLTGFGALWLVLVVVAATDARLGDAVPSLAVGVVALALGTAIGALAPGVMRGGRRARPQLGRDDSISYFRDVSRSASGVHEEDEPRRWGGGAR